jgi:hypothetical protein
MGDLYQYSAIFISTHAFYSHYLIHVIPYYSRLQAFKATNLSGALRKSSLFCCVSGKGGDCAIRAAFCAMRVHLGRDSPRVTSFQSCGTRGARVVCAGIANGLMEGAGLSPLETATQLERLLGGRGSIKNNQQPALFKAGHDMGVASQPFMRDKWEEAEVREAGKDLLVPGLYIMRGFGAIVSVLCMKPVLVLEGAYCASLLYEVSIACCSCSLTRPITLAPRRLQGGSRLGVGLQWAAVTLLFFLLFFLLF